MKKIYKKSLFNHLLLFFCTYSTIAHGENTSINPVEQWHAEEYVENGLLQFKWAKKFFFDRFVWSGNENVLDIGCGDGRLTHLISSYVPQGIVLGMDNSLSMIQHAHQTYPSDIFSNLSFEVADASNSLFYEKLNSKFDVIVSFHCLHWIDNQKNVLLGIKKSLRHKGKAFLRLTSNGWDPIQEVADELINSPKWCNHFIFFNDPIHRYSKESYEILINEVGLYSKRIEELVENDTLSNVEVLAKQIKSWLPHLKHLPLSLQKDFLSDVIMTYLSKVPPSDDGSIHLYDCYLEVELEKP